jgi:4-hydroxybenzoyl-CoA thioesterase
MTALVHRRTLTIEWGQCDPAGIVFYPNYLAMFDTSTGQLFARTGLSPAQMRKHYGIIGLPLVEQGARFIIPCKFDDEVTIESEAGEWGRSSFVVRHRLLKSGELAVEGWEKRIWAIADPEHPGRIKPQPIPREIVASLSDPTGQTRCVP